MNKLFCLLGILIFPLLMQAQEEEFRSENFVYKENIKSALIHRPDSVLADPIVFLNSPVQLRFSFDDMDADVKDYYYTLTLCDADWKPSELDELDYLDGFTENDLEDYQFSFNTLTEYTHFFLDLPNEDVRWTKSGNYLLRVYENEDELSLAITQRFVVAERTMQVEGNFVRPGNPAISSTHQEFDFVVRHPNLRIVNAQDEISVTILQNNRWDNALTNLKPRFARNEQLVYDYQGKIIFPAGKEFRHVDLRNLESRTGRVREIEEYEDHYDAYIKEEKPRPYLPYTSGFDINGKFVIENLDVFTPFNQTIDAAVEKGVIFTKEGRTEHDRQGNYVNAYFSLRAPIPYDGKKVYLFGALTAWQIQPQYQLEYNDANNAYEGAAYLKQGYYDYLYALVDEDDPKKIDFSLIEGDWHETENNYTVLVYWRAFGQRYDRVAAVKVFNSVRTE